MAEIISYIFQINALESVYDPDVGVTAVVAAAAAAAVGPDQIVNDDLKQKG